MKAVILAGGFGTRISEESHLKPKPMIEIGEMPILWHIMKLYSYYGVNEFVICAGYKQHVIKEWFADYFLHTSDITFDFTNGNNIIVHKQHAEPWKVTVVDTGLNTMTGGRVKRIKKYVENETFYLTYGDAVSDVNINKLLEFHKSHGKICTLTSVSIAQQKGVLDILFRRYGTNTSVDGGGLKKRIKHELRYFGKCRNQRFKAVKKLLDFRADKIEGDNKVILKSIRDYKTCLLYTSPSPRDS